MTGILLAVVIVDPPIHLRYECGQSPHVTLQHGAERMAWEELIGRPVTVSVLGERWNNRIQAIALTLPPWVPCQNPYPHIAVSWRPTAEPLEANRMLANSHESSPLPFDSLKCRIEWQEWGDLPFNARKWCHRIPRNCPTCRYQGIETLNRSMTGYCRRHRPKERYS